MEGSYPTAVCQQTFVDFLKEVHQEDVEDILFEMDYTLHYSVEVEFCVFFPSCTPLQACAVCVCVCVSLLSNPGP